MKMSKVHQSKIVIELNLCYEAELAIQVDVDSTSNCYLVSGRIEYQEFKCSQERMQASHHLLIDAIKHCRNMLIKDLKAVMNEYDLQKSFEKQHTTVINDAFYEALTVSSYW